MERNGLFYGRSMIRFSLKNATKELSPIRLRINLNGERMTFYLPQDYKICPKHWDKEVGGAIEDSKRNPDLKGNPQLQLIMRNINKEIEKTTNALITVLEELKLHNICPTAELVRKELRKELQYEVKEKQRFADFINYMEYYISLCKNGTILNSKGARLVPGTIKGYIATKTILKRYCQEQNTTLQMDNMGMNFYHDFVLFMNEAKHSRGTYKTNVIGKYIKNIKVMLRYAYDNHYTQNDEFKRKEFKAYKENVETIYLTETELSSLYELKLNESESNVRDSFIISCYTGLRYSDIARLQQKHLDFEKKLLTIVTQKTNTRVIIPIHPKVEAILRKYNNNPPKAQSNQSTNRMLKRLCRKAKITNFVSIMETSGGVHQEITREKCDMVTSHTARRSFATNAYKAGIPSLSIMQITGHRTESSFMKYIRISKEENAISLSKHSFFK